MIQTATKTNIGNTKIQKKYPTQSLQLSPLDLCLKRGIISKDMHKAANFFIYLYYIRYGNKRITSDYGHSLRPKFYISNAKQEDIHNALYKKLSRTLIKEQSYTLIRNICIFSSFPHFLRVPNFKPRSITNKRNIHEYKLFLEGMNTIVKILETPLSKKYYL